MGRRISNAYAHPAQNLPPQDLAMAQNFYGAAPNPMGPPEPSQGEWLQRAQQGQPGALGKSIGSLAAYPGGSLRDPMAMGEHGRENSHLGSARPIAEFDGIMDEKWDEFKAKIGAGKAMAGKVPPKKKLPPGAPPKDHESVIAAAAAAHTPDDDGGIKELGKLIDKYEKGDGKVDLSPLLALTDSWTGSQLQKGYDAPLSDEEREAIVLKLKGKLTEQKENLAYKRDYMSQQKEENELRRKMAEQKQKDDAELKLQLARIRGDQQEASRDASAMAKEGTSKSRYLKENKNAVKAIAKKRYGGANPEDRSYELRVGPINDEIFEFGKHLEKEGGVKPGMGYNTALEFYLANAQGPDGAE